MSSPDPRATPAEFDLIPYVGASSARFGMTPVEVGCIWGAPETVDRTFAGTRREYRNATRVGVSYDSEVRAVEFAFVPGCRVVLQGVSVFECADPLESLVRLDAEPFTSFGFVVFLRIGVTLTGYHDHDTSQRALCLFARGRWERDRDQLVPFSR